MQSLDMQSLFFREISLAAKYFNMEDPEEVLKRRN